MKLSDILLAEFEREMKVTLKFFESLPDELFEYAPHEKSRNLGSLANHMLPIPTWIQIIINESKLDWMEQTPPVSVKNKSSLVDKFQENIKIGREALSQVTDEKLAETWVMCKGDTIMFKGEKQAAIRYLIINHTIHHRAQMGVYLRLNDEKVPASYVASADDSML